MEEPQAVIADAFAKLKQSISEEDAHNFASTELEDVWTAVREIESQQRKRQSAQNLRRIEPLLRGMEKYTKVIEVLCNGTPYMPYAWAPIKLMLEIASRHRDVFEALLSAYADIGAALPRFDRYNEAFSKNLEFQNALAAVYVGILDFHQRAYKYFRRRAWHILFLSLWKDFGNRFDNIVTSLKKQRDFIDIEAVSFDIVEAKQARIQMQDEIRRRQKQELKLLEENEKNAKISQLQHAFAWISADGKAQETQYERTLKRRHSGTCRWLTDEPHFKSWIKDDSRRPCLWLDGKPGSDSIADLKIYLKTLTDTSGLTICYYFCNSQDIGNVCHEILMTIVLQILRQHPDICTLVTNNYVYQGLSSGMVQLRALLPQLLEVIGYIRVVVDGIDECPKESQKAILKEIQTICTTPITHCKVLFSSRKEVHIRQRLSGLPQISLDGRQEVDWDIRTFVKFKISKLQTADQRLLNMIESLLVEKANGMFLWVRLVAHELKYCYSNTALEETAMRLPQGLKAAYGRILDRIMNNDSRNAKYMALRILGWMSCAHRALKTYEILDGIAFDSSNTNLTTKAKIGKEILDLCHPLIEEGPKNTVDFVHFSAKEYILEEEYQAARPFICRQNAHLDISFSCVTLLNSCSQLLPLNSTQGQRAAVVVQGFHGLLVYAEAFWYKHLLEYCSSPNRQLLFSPELLAQLKLLLKFRKEGTESFDIGQNIELQSGMETRGLEGLNHLPDIKRFVLDVLMFRTKMNKEYGTNNCSEIPSLKSCDKDPTEFGSIRYHYQIAVELLLDSKAIEKLPNLSEYDLQFFRETYGPSGFLCRYLHCVSSTDGFDSSLERVKHESQHQRKFRCAYPTCVYFRPGFINRTMLNKHNEKYHLTVANGPSLAQSITNMQRPPNFMQMDQRNSQMEVLDIPQVLLVHQHMPQGFPPEVKKWRQMKHWVSQNPAMGPPHLDAVNKLQRLHLQMIMKQRQQPQPGGMQPGAPIPQGGAPPNPVGMGAAPVATTVPIQMGMGPGNELENSKILDWAQIEGSALACFDKPLSKEETTSKLLVLLIDMRVQTAASIWTLSLDNRKSFFNPFNNQPRKPKSLQDMELKLLGDEYSTAEEFVRDATLIFQDFRTDQNEIARFKATTELENYMWMIIKQVPEWSYLWHLEPQLPSPI